MYFAHIFFLCDFTPQISKYYKILHFSFDFVHACMSCLSVLHVSIYQAGERGHVHDDGDHATGEAELAEPSVSLRKKRGEVEPTEGQHRRCHQSL